ncbi:hypothetical protein BDN67DRAFT_1016712 [Paxillus ammoniavirescens]|nr:hypothetical protein BDN67DRAFT_1016712 [Paxillus ammoniavirescens]
MSSRSHMDGETKTGRGADKGKASVRGPRPKPTIKHSKKGPINPEIIISSDDEDFPDKISHGLRNAPSVSHKATNSTNTPLAHESDPFQQPLQPNLPVDSEHAGTGIQFLGAVKGPLEQTSQPPASPSPTRRQPIQSLTAGLEEPCLASLNSARSTEPLDSPPKVIPPASHGPRPLAVESTIFFGTLGASGGSNPLTSRPTVIIEAPMSGISDLLVSHTSATPQPAANVSTPPCLPATATNTAPPSESGVEVPPAPQYGLSERLHHAYPQHREWLDPQLAGSGHQIGGGYAAASQNTYNHYHPYQLEPHIGYANHTLGRDNPARPYLHMAPLHEFRDPQEDARLYWDSHEISNHPSGLSFDHPAFRHGASGAPHACSSPNNAQMLNHPGPSSDQHTYGHGLRVPGVSRASCDDIPRRQQSSHPVTSSDMVPTSEGQGTTSPGTE